MQTTFVTLLAAAAFLAGCGSDDRYEPAAAKAPAAGGEDLGAIKGYLLQHTEDLGVPTWETLGAQAVALVFVIGSYHAAEYVRITRPRRQAAARRAAAGPEPAPQRARAVLAPARELERAER